MGIIYFLLGSILTVLIFVWWSRHHNKEKAKLELTISTNNLKIKGNIKMLSLKQNQKVSYELTPIDEQGNPAPVEAGTCQVTSSAPNVFRVEIDPTNELKGEIFSGELGTGQLDYSADADLGNGVVTIAGFSAVEVIPAGAQAVGFGITFGTPVDV
jgi:hypothetical protein